MRLIDADAKMVAQLNDFETESVVEKEMTVDDYLSLSDYDAPTIDAVPATIEGALGYLHKVGWMQEHDRIMTEGAAPVVRCKDCVNLYKGEFQSTCRYATYIYSMDDYCSHGERKDDE